MEGKMKIRFYRTLVLLQFIFLIFNPDVIAQINYLSSLYTEGISENSMGEIFVGVGDSFGQSGTIYKSSNSGKDWIEIDSGIVWADVFEIKISSNDYVYFTGYSTGIYRSTSNGNYWEQLNLFNYIPTDSYALLVADNDYIFIGIGDNPPYYLARSTDYGDNWADLSGWVSDRVYSLASFQNNIYAGTAGEGVKVSTNYGNSWHQSSLDSMFISYLTVNDSGDVFAGNWWGRLFRSTDNGTNWVGLSNPWENSNSCIASILTIEPNFIFVGLGRWASVIDSNLIYRSSDSGSSWKLSDEGIYSDAINNLLLSSDNSLYATTRDGLYKSTDFGDSWFPVAPFVTGLISTNSGIPDEYKLKQNYPNPFNPNTTINYEIPQAGLVSIKVYDVLGQEIATLVNEEKQSGKYEISFNAVGLASGVYIYRMKVNNFIESKKMILLR
jgi:photosystem II stability/assembly factor-like uncharacterized protein